MRIKLYSILVYKLLFAQAPIPVCLDGTIIRAIIDSSTILVTVCITVVMLWYDWWLRMVINIQYSGGLLPDIILC